MPREIPAALQAHATPDGQVDTGLLEPYMVGSAFVDRHIRPTVLDILFHGLRQFRLCHWVVFVRHPYVPKDVMIPDMGYKPVTRLLLFSVPKVLYLEFAGLAVVIHLEVVVVASPETLEVSVLKRHTLGLPGQLVGIGVKPHPFILEIIHSVGIPAVILTLLASDGAHAPRPTRIYAAESIFLKAIIHTVDSGAGIHVLLPTWKHQTAVTVTRGVDIARATHRE